MVEVTVIMQVLPDKRRELIQTLDELASLKQKAPGFISSNIRFDAGFEQGIVLMDRWESQADAETYLRSEHFDIFRGALQLLTTSARIDMNGHPLPGIKRDGLAKRIHASDRVSGNGGPDYME